MAKQKFFRVQIPEPCAVPWESMTIVDDERRHCLSCEKIITDFTEFSDDELILFFKHSKGKLCGRFRRDQLNKPLPLLPEKTNSSGWWKPFLMLALGIFAKHGKAQENFRQSEKELITAVKSTVEEIAAEKTAPEKEVAKEKRKIHRPFLKPVDVEVLIYPVVTRTVMAINDPVVMGDFVIETPGQKLWIQLFGKSVGEKEGILPGKKTPDRLPSEPEEKPGSNRLKAVLPSRLKIRRRK